ncbi:MAG TPA: radical SAM family heme chaperone HemW [Thermotogota bacterium]|nr:radical SAM family heme chaperone HemW [Thermotogota bacterium]HRW92046.1 radical SAM family heme chaperone HemW [Thermotogota bacterium]
MPSSPRYLPEKPIALYIHVPACACKCAYCDFFSLPRTQWAIGWEEFFSLLQGELSESQRREELHSGTISSVYIGGGNPGLVPVRLWELFFRQLEQSFPAFSRGEVEWTLECNPENIGEDNVKGWQALGINRLSVGLQCFEDAVLKDMGRGYTLFTFERKMEIVKRFFDQFNIDLILGFPGQELDLSSGISRLVETLSPPHLSLYLLELHEGTPLFQWVSKGQRRLPEEDTLLHAWERNVQYLVSKGYENYEISNFCTPGNECAHNLAYWHNHDYLGLGPSAGSHVGFHRWVNASSMDWRIGQGRVYDQQNDASQELLETLFMGLRLQKGVRLEILEGKFGEQAIQKLCQSMASHDLFQVQEGHLRLSRKGWRKNALAFSELLDFFPNRGN